MSLTSPFRASLSRRRMASPLLRSVDVAATKTKQVQGPGLTLSVRFLYHSATHGVCRQVPPCGRSTSTLLVGLAESSNLGQMSLLEQHFQEMLRRETLELVTNPESPGFYRRVFLVPTKSGGLRPVLDLSLLNHYLKPIRFRMEVTASFCASLRPGMWTFSIDLSDAYFHIPIHPSSRRFLRVEFRGKVSQFRALSFGFNSAPWLFTKVQRGEGYGSIKRHSHSPVSGRLVAHG